MASFPAMARSRAPADPWGPTLDRVSRAVMVLQVAGTRSLDTENASYTSGTGFVVDKERGLILTNRHMVHVGPVVAKGITHSREELRLYPVYRDPVHDFGFYRFDPAEVKYMDIEELPLVPEAAKVGVEIKVVGNDANEQLSILGGTLARLDREPPEYGSGNYNDFNTFYYQAATSTSGGSSGSPVVDVMGRVLALNAGGSRQAATSYYLPIQLAAHVLEHLRAGTPITRGTLQVVYSFEPFDELRRLGLRPATEEAVRQAHPQVTGMLVAREIIPGGPADGLLRPGDILVRADGSLLDDYSVMEGILDERVGMAVEVEVERSGSPLTADITVGDLSRLSPARYVEFSQGILQEVSLQMARGENVPARGVMVTEPGYAMRRASLWHEALIETIDDKVIANLDDLVRVLSGLADGQRVRVRYHNLSAPQDAKITSLTVDRRWSPTRLCDRDDSTGLWDCEDVPEPSQAMPPSPTPPAIPFEELRDPVASLLVPSFCFVRFTLPYRTEGVEGSSYLGAGLVVDTERGLVVTDRGTIPVRMGDVELTFAGSARIPAQVVYLHPVHNIAILQYDPKALGALPVRAATLLPGSSPEAGTEVYQVGLTSAQRIVHQKSTISRVDHVGNSTNDPPSFRDYNTEVYRLVESASTIGGVLADARGRVIALWVFQARGNEGSFLGLPVELVADVVEPLRAGRDPALRNLGIEVSPLDLASLRDLGAPDTWIARLAQADPQRRQAIRVERVMPGSPAAAILQGGDVILSIQDQAITRPLQVERIPNQALGALSIQRLRNGQVDEIRLDPITLDGRGLDKAVIFAGAMLHEPHWQVGLQHGLEPGGLYVSWYWYGSPADQYGLRASAMVRSVNDVPVTSIDTFLAAVRDLEDRQPFRLGVESLQRVQDVITLENDRTYWPTALVVSDSEGWHYASIVPPSH